MGLPGYHSWLKDKYDNEGWVDILNITLPNLIKWLAIDAASVIHEVNALVRGYSSSDDSTEIIEQKRIRRSINATFSEAEIEIQVFAAITQQLMALIQAANPTEGVMVAMDGVAPQGKIQQQRFRRFRSTISDPSTGDILTSQMKKSDLKTREQIDSFDTNSITPGTDFMYRLTRHIQNWIDTNRLNLPRQIIFSSHLVPGEGEHKIMEYIRNGTIKSDPILNEGQIVVHAKDADLIFLMMMTEADNLTLWREGIAIVNIDNLRRRITQKMSPEIVENDTPSTIVDYGKIDDYVFLMFFLGNDFLPKHPALSNFGRYNSNKGGRRKGGNNQTSRTYISDSLNSIDELVKLYRAYNSPRQNAYGQMENQELAITDDGVVLWPNLLYFLQGLALKESGYLENEAKIDFTYRSRMYTESITSSRTSSGLNIGNVILDRRNASNRSGQGNIKIVKTFSMHNFTNAWYNNALYPRGDRKLLLLSAMLMGNKESIAYWTPTYDINKNVTRDQGLSGDPSRESMVYNYLTGLAWVYSYYRYGAKGINTDWYYLYYYAPLINDMHKYLQEVLDPQTGEPKIDSDQQPLVLSSWKPIPGQKPLKPYEQLLSVLPPQSFALVPPSYQWLMSPDSPIFDYYPTDFVIELDGKNKFHEGIPIIPFVDSIRIRNAANRITLPSNIEQMYEYTTDYIPPMLTKTQESIKNRDNKISGVCTTASLGYKSFRVNQDRQGQQQRKQQRDFRRDNQRQRPTFQQRQRPTFQHRQRPTFQQKQRSITQQRQTNQQRPAFKQRQRSTIQQRQRSTNQKSEESVLFPSKSTLPVTSTSTSTTSTITASDTLKSTRGVSRGGGRRRFRQNRPTLSTVQPQKVDVKQSEEVKFNL